MINKSIFKSYDVRGIYPDELDMGAAYAIGKAFVVHTGCKNVVVGHDARLSALELQKALVGGLREAGATITLIGQVPTECIYFALGNNDYEGAIMITASHNPKDYNGLKMMKKVEGEIEIIRGVDLLNVVKEEVFDGQAAEAGAADHVKQDYLDFITAKIDLSVIKPFKVVVDASNGVMGPVLDMLADKLPIKIVPLNFTPDGSFPNHSPNPLDKGASDQIAALIKEEKADFGFMFDGDADRIFLVDENGSMVSADVVLLLLAKQFLADNPGKGIAYNLICSRSVPELVAKWGGKPIRTKVGFVNVREGLMQNDGVMGGELSAHYCFKDYFYCDSGMIAFLTLLQIISKEGKPVSEMVKELSVYAPPYQTTFKITDSAPVLEKVKQTYADAKQDYLDGLTVEYQDWWFNLRSSNTEPLLKLTIEATTQELLEEKKKELEALVAA